MSTTRELIGEWFDQGLRTANVTHMIIVCDTFDYEDYPVYVTSDQSCRTEAEKYNEKNMQKIMEVYDLRMDRDQQLTARRCFNY
jgi:hypothetical protein